MLAEPVVALVVWAVVSDAVWPATRVSPRGRWVQPVAWVVADAPPPGSPRCSYPQARMLGRLLGVSVAGVGLC